eukprot:TRINITY_DN13605_c0_g1_i1.p1 TRINITY_DN13605_c0_g1~~TRINITY_DN13605_c0_g1_i1.p1  ORF type:complete len:626 (+),score=175.18 TRINITY_DN13605_c0_g1_i1:72-1880(+)
MAGQLKSLFTLPAAASQLAEGGLSSAAVQLKTSLVAPNPYLPMDNIHVVVWVLALLGGALWWTKSSADGSGKKIADLQARAIQQAEPDATEQAAQTASKPEIEVDQSSLSAGSMQDDTRAAAEADADGSHAEAATTKACSTLTSDDKEEPCEVSAEATPSTQFSCHSASTLDLCGQESEVDDSGYEPSDEAEATSDEHAAVATTSDDCSHCHEQEAQAPQPPSGVDDSLPDYARENTDMDSIWHRIDTETPLPAHSSRARTPRALNSRSISEEFGDWNGAAVGAQQPAHSSDPYFLTPTLSFVIHSEDEDDDCESNASGKGEAEVEDIIQNLGLDIRRLREKLKLQGLSPESILEHQEMRAMVSRLRLLKNELGMQSSSSESTSPLAAGASKSTSPAFRTPSETDDASSGEAAEEERQQALREYLTEQQQVEDLVNLLAKEAGQTDLSGVDVSSVLAMPGDTLACKWLTAVKTAEAQKADDALSRKASALDLFEETTLHLSHNSSSSEPGTPGSATSTTKRSEIPRLQLNGLQKSYTTVTSEADRLEKRGTPSPRSSGHHADSGVSKTFRKVFGCVLEAAEGVAQSCRNGPATRRVSRASRH